MKIQTKYKILDFVYKILKLPDTRNLPPYDIQTRDIQKIKSERQLNEIETYFFKDNEDYYMTRLKHELSINLAKVMQQIGAIKYEIDADMYSGNIKIIATTYVPEKL